jgi:hypothetical protein
MKNKGIDVQNILWNCHLMLGWTWTPAFNSVQASWCVPINSLFLLSPFRPSPSHSPLSLPLLYSIPRSRFRCGEAPQPDRSSSPLSQTLGGILLLAEFNRGFIWSGEFGRRR